MDMKWESPNAETPIFVTKVCELLRKAGFYKKDDTKRLDVGYPITEERAKENEH